MRHKSANLQEHSTSDIPPIQSILELAMGLQLRVLMPDMHWRVHAILVWNAFMMLSQIMVGEFTFGLTASFQSSSKSSRSTIPYLYASSPQSAWIVHCGKRWRATVPLQHHHPQPAPLQQESRPVHRPVRPLAGGAVLTRHPQLLALRQALL
jgi:hypothetical protein